jgi:hypothetical protein
MGAFRYSGLFAKKCEKAILLIDLLREKLQKNAFSEKTEYLNAPYDDHYQ